jgi:hypothetical protein
MSAKLKLDLDALAVETFGMQEHAEIRGTVGGHFTPTGGGPSCFQTCNSCDSCDTCGDGNTCVSCAATCAESCLVSCFSCWATCNCTPPGHTDL